MKNALMGIIKMKKQLEDSVRTYQSALDTLVDISDGNGFEYGFQEVYTGSIVIEDGSTITWRFEENMDPMRQYVIIFNNVTTGEENEVVLNPSIGIDPQYQLFEGIKFQDILVSYNNAMLMDDVIVDMAGSFLYSPTMSLNQANSIANGYISQITNSDIETFMNFLAVSGDKISSFKFTTIVTEMYKATQSSYTKVEQGESDLFVLDKTKITVQCFNTSALASVVGGILQMAGTVLTIINPVIGVLVGVLGSVLSSLYNVAAKESFQRNVEVDNDFFNTPMISATIYENDIQLPGQSGVGYQQPNSSTASFDDRNTNFITYRWRRTDMLSYINTFAVASINFRNLRDLWSTTYSGQFLPKGSPREARPDNSSLPNNDRTKGVIFNQKDLNRLTDDFQYSHDEIVNLNDNELAAMYAFSIWSLLMKLTGNAGYRGTYGNLKWISITNGKTVSSTEELDSSMPTGNRWKYMISKLTNIIWYTLNYEGSACDFSYAGSCVKFIASCYAFLIDYFFSGCPTSVQNGVTCISVYGVNQMIQSGSPYLAPSAPTSSSDLNSPLVGVYGAYFADLVPFLASGTKVEYNSTNSTWAYVNVYSTQYEIDSIPSDRTLLIPEYTKGALAAAIALGAAITLVAGVAIKLAKTKIGRVVNNKARENKKKIDGLYDKWQNAKESGDDVAAATFKKEYEKKVKKTNFYSKLFGWPGYDPATGLTTSNKAQLSLLDTSNTTEQNSNDIINLIKG